ncbi:protealysin inhibitor emfourin [Planctomonas deserti]|uniref:protealysin inhibitor emfourin n=1 Tax=Planctomonas deserti TaxID=2144185 RepID=UPI00197B59E3|nr:protealysin inhibitor emfourin [Planctomonas deserti]
MRVVVARSGGVTGIAVRWVVDLGEGPEYSDWIVLIEACPWDDEPDDPPAPDRFLYLIRANGRRVTLPEQRVQGPWRELVDRVRAVGTPERGRALPPLDDLDATDDLDTADNADTTDDAARTRGDDRPNGPRGSDGPA